MNIEQAKELEARGIKPYDTFRFLDKPFRWLAVWLCWNLGVLLGKLECLTEKETPHNGYGPKRKT